MGEVKDVYREQISNKDFYKLLENGRVGAGCEMKEEAEAVRGGLREEAAYRWALRHVYKPCREQAG